MSKSEDYNKRLWFEKQTFVIWDVDHVGHVQTIVSTRYITLFESPYVVLVYISNLEMCITNT